MPSCAHMPKMKFFFFTVPTVLLRFLYLANLSPVLLNSTWAPTIPTWPCRWLPACWTSIHSSTLPSRTSRTPLISPPLSLYWTPPNIALPSLRSWTATRVAITPICGTPFPTWSPPLARRRSKQRRSPPRPRRRKQASFWQPCYVGWSCPRGCLVGGSLRCWGRHAASWSVWPALMRPSAVPPPSPGEKFPLSLIDLFWFIQSLSES